jgi:hypothetical protein
MVWVISSVRAWFSAKVTVCVRDLDTAQLRSRVRSHVIS